MTIHRFRFYSLSYAIFFGLLSVGCAVQTTPKGDYQVGLDISQLLGNEVGSFDLPGGNHGTLRVLGGKYTLKVGNTMRQVPLDDIVSARIVQFGLVGDRTLVVLEASKKGCDRHLLLFAIKGWGVSHWTIGDCRSSPVITMSKQDAIFDFVYPVTQVRFRYKDGNVERSEGTIGASTYASNQYKSSGKLASSPSTSTSFEVPQPPHLVRAEKSPKPPAVQVASPKAASRTTKKEDGASSVTKQVVAPSKPDVIVFSQPEKMVPQRIILD